MLHKIFYKMKRLFSLALLAVSATCGAYAQSYDYLTFQQTDGTEKALPAVGTKITFADGQLVATNGTETLTYSVADVQKMFFAAAASGIASAEVGSSISATIVDGQLKVNAPTGTAVALYNAEGRRISTSARLDKGLYVVRVGNETLKLLSE